MKKRAIASIIVLTMMMSLVFTFSWSPNVNATGTPVKLTLTPSMVTNESGLGSAGNLVDEQTLAGDLPTGAVTTQWFPGDSATYPASCYIDLGQSYVISKIYMYDEAGSGNYVVSSGTPGSWTSLFTDGLANWRVWNLHTVSVTTRYIRCSMQVSTARMNEIVIYGYPAGSATPTPTPTATPTSTPTATPTPGTPVKLTLTASMVTSESGLGTPGKLVDEQALAGDPPSGACTTYYHPGWSASYYPASCYINLGQNYVITKIYLRDVGGDGNYIVSSGAPGNWTPLFTDTLSNWNVWNLHTVNNVTTNYIRCTMSKDSADMSEIVIYGYPATGPTPTPAPTVTPTPGGPIKIAVLGSSSAAGAGPLDSNNAWVNRYRVYMQSLNAGNQVINMGYWGYTTYQEMPISFVPPEGRPTPDPNYSITKAIALDVDAIIISLPTNDIASGYTMAELQSNFNAMIAAAQAAQIPVWVTTSMPRDSCTDAQRQDLITMIDWTYTRFGERAIDFWTDLGDSTGHIVPQYSAGDTIHFNDAAHLVMFNRVVAKTPDIIYAIQHGLTNP